MSGVLALTLLTSSVRKDPGHITGPCCTPCGHVVGICLGIYCGQPPVPIIDDHEGVMIWHSHKFSLNDTDSEWLCLCRNDHSPVTNDK